MKYVDIRVAPFIFCLMRTGCSDGTCLTPVLRYLGIDDVSFWGISDGNDGYFKAGPYRSEGDGS